MWQDCIKPVGANGGTRLSRSVGKHKPGCGEGPGLVGRSLTKPSKIRKGSSRNEVDAFIEYKCSGTVLGVLISTTLNYELIVFLFCG